MLIVLVVMYALLASTFSLGKVLLNYAQPIFVVGVRMSIAGAILLIYHLVTKKKITLPKTSYLTYLQIILCTAYFPYIFRFWGLQSLPSSKASLLYLLSPFISYLFSYLICSEKVTFKKIVGLIIGFLGFIPTFMLQKSSSYSLLSISSAELFIILAVTCMSYGWILVHKLLKEQQASIPMLNGVSMFCGGILALITSFFFESGSPIKEPAPFISIVSIIIVVSNLLCHNLYAGLLTYYTPTFVSFASFLSPLFAALYGWLFLHETISWQFYLTACCVTIGLTIFYHDELKQSSTVVTTAPS